MDSTVLTWWLVSEGVEVLAVFVDYGHHAAAEERSTLEVVKPTAVEVLDVDVSAVYAGLKSGSLQEPDLWAEPVTEEDFHLPARNLLLLSIGTVAAERAGRSQLYAAFISSNLTEAGDRSPGFFDAAASVAAECSAVTVHLPFLSLTKRDVAALGIALGVPIGRTFSCQAASHVPCGACANCLDRLDAIGALGAG
jgi:7-cyano-7-deazaguanine synthase